MKKTIAILAAIALAAAPAAYAKKGGKPHAPKPPHTAPVKVK